MLAHIWGWLHWLACLCADSIACYVCADKCCRWADFNALIWLLTDFFCHLQGTFYSPVYPDCANPSSSTKYALPDFSSLTPDANTPARCMNALDYQVCAIMYKHASPCICLRLVKLRCRQGMRFSMHLCLMHALLSRFLSPHF